MRHSDGIERIGAEAVEPEQQEHQPAAARIEQHGEEADDRREAAEPDDDDAPVDLVAEASERRLRDGADDGGDSEEIGDGRGIEPLLIAIDRRERAEGAVGHAAGEGGDHRERRGLVEQHHVEPRRGDGPGLRRRGQRGRQQRADEGDGADDEGHVAERAGDRHGQLPDGRGGHVDGGVDREDRAAAAVVGHLVEPALDDHGGAGEAEAGEGAHHDPANVLDPHQVEQDRHRADRRHDRVGADVPHALDQQRHGDRAGNEAHRPAGADEAERGEREPFLGAANRQQQALQPAAEHQQGRTDEQGIDLQCGGHGAFCDSTEARRLPVESDQIRAGHSRPKDIPRARAKSGCSALVVRQAHHEGAREMGALREKRA